MIARFGAGLLALPFGLWLLAAFAAPMGAVALLSVQESSEMFAPLSLVPSGVQYEELLADGFIMRVFFNTLLLGAAVAAACAVLGYPLALWLTRKQREENA